MDNIFGAINLDSITHELCDTISGVILQPAHCKASSTLLASFGCEQLCKAIRTHVLSVCTSRNLVPVAAGCHSFASSRAAIATKIDASALEKEIVAAREAVWCTSVVVNADCIPLISKDVMDSKRKYSSIASNLMEFLASPESKVSQEYSLHFSELEEDFFFCLQFLDVFFTGSYQFTFNAAKGTTLTDAHTFVSS